MGPCFGESSAETALRKRQMSPRLTAIGLQNFQVFEHYTRIPIAPLTLLYGPNSAGKSAVLDAIRLAKLFWSESFQGTRMVFRADGDNEYHGSTVWKGYADLRRVRGDIHAEGDTLIDIEFTSHSLRPDVATKAVSNVSVRILLCPNTWASGVSLTGIALWLNDEIICNIDGSGYSINIAHLSLSYKEYWKKIAQRDNEVYGYPITLNETWASVPYEWGDVSRELKLNLSLSYLKEEEKKRASDPAVIARIKSFAEQYSIFSEALCRPMERVLDFNHMGPSRSIPTPEEVTYLVPWVEAQRDPFGIKAKGIKEYRNLAIEGFHRFLDEKFPTTWYGPHGNEPETHQIERVNHLLRHHLLLDRAYQIIGNVRFFVVDPDWLHERNSFQDTQDLGDFWAIVRLKLIDPEGRKFDFTEVGSGLGYLFPILVGTTAKTNCMIEQPELHLHPALQSALGDLFIDVAGIESKESRMMIIETHSEHLLLRMLKRIRQTNGDKPIDQSLRLRAEDLSVLYFEPLSDATTRVKQLRVTEEGDFMDRWPQGFFEERDRELFDE
jgi:predicted ATPase